MGKLTEYLLKLAGDSNEHQKLQASKAAAHASIDASDLSDEHKNLLKAGDCQGINKALQDESAAEGRAATPPACQSCTTNLKFTLHVSSGD